MAAILAGTATCWRPSEDVRVVLITLDTLRYDCFEGTTAAGTTENATTMPYLRRWAETATVFDRFYTATASTQPSHASMFTGLHPWQHGVSGNGMALAERYLTVAEQLRDAGFATAAAVGSFPVSRRFGFGQGFERFHDEFVIGEVLGGEWLDAARQAEARSGLSETEPSDPFYSLADTVTARALADLDAATARRQFFWFHFFDPHSPYGDSTDEPTTSPPEVLRVAARGEDPAPALAHARRLYDADVSNLDAALGRLLDRLEEDASRFTTHVVIVADHGESFGEEGSVAHGRRLIPSQLHVPCVIRSPHLAPGVRHDVAGSVDVAATLLTLAGVDAELARPPASRDLTRPIRRPPQVFGMRRTYKEPYEDRRLDGSVEEIAGHLFFFLNEKGELFRGNEDTLLQPTENESALAPEEAQRLRQLFGEFEDELARNQAESDPDPEAKEKLKALGYVD